MAAAAAAGHPLNAAFAAWVQRAAASDPAGDWSGAVAAYVAHAEALLAEARAAQEPARPAAKKAAGGREAPQAAASPPAQQAQGGAPDPGHLTFFGQRAAEPPARREDNPFAQGLDLEKEVRGRPAAAAITGADRCGAPAPGNEQVAAQKAAAAKILAERAAREEADRAARQAEAEAEARATGSKCVPPAGHLARRGAPNPSTAARAAPCAAPLTARPRPQAVARLQGPRAR